MADTNPNNGHGNAPSQRDKEKRSRAGRVAKAVGKGIFYTTPVGMAVGATKIARSSSDNSLPENTSSLNPQEAVVEAERIISEKQQNPNPSTQKTPPKQSSRLGNATKNAAKGAGKVYMYTSPGAFVVGKLLGRRKERKQAQEQIEDLERKATNTTSKKSKNSMPHLFSKPTKAMGSIIAKTSGAYWIHRYAMKHLPNQTKAFDSLILSPFRKKPNKQGNHKSEIDYIRNWNKKTLEKTSPHRKFIKENLNKALQSKAWKYGKYVISPGGAISSNLYKKYHKKPEEKDTETDSFMRPFGNRKKETVQKPKIPGKFQRYTKSSGKAIYKYTTPVGQAQAVWNKWGKPRALNLNNRLGRRFGNAASPRQLGNRAAKKIGSQIGKTIAKQAVMTFFKTPPGWITLGVIALIFLFLGVMVLITTTLNGGGSGGGSQVGGGVPIGGTPQQPNNPIPGLTLTLSALSSVPNSEDIVYTVRVSYDETLLPAPVDNIEIVNIIPTTTRFVKTTGVPSSTTGGTIVWPLSSSANRSEFTFTLSPVQDDIIVNNSIYAILASNQSLGGANPTATNCNGAYSLDNPIGNFGDPDCFVAENNAQAKSEMYALLKSLDPTHADGWFLKVIPCESVPSYNPNSHSGQAAIGSPDVAGVWGLFSMGRGLNGEYDHGDVPWRDQISNAVNYGKILTSNGLSLGEYWQCWR